MATLTIPPVLKSPRDDAIELYKAFKGFGCDDTTVINILAHRDATQRLLIQQEYNAMYHDSLLKRLTSELTGKFEDAVLLWMHDPPGRDATIIRQALVSDNIDLVGAIEVICSRTPSQIQVLKQHYFAKFGTSLEQDIDTHFFGDERALLLAYVSTPRYEGPEVQKEAAEHDAKSLYKAGERKWGTDEKVFVGIFSQRSGRHLAAVDSAYKHTYGNSLKKVVKNETSGNFKHALLTILQCSENPAKYFAKVLHRAMAGLGTNDSTLIRVIVTRTEIDMQYIKVEYLKKYKKTLNAAVHSETSGSYRGFLEALLGPNH